MKDIEIGDIWHNGGASIRIIEIENNVAICFRESVDSNLLGFNIQKVPLKTIYKYYTFDGTNSIRFFQNIADAFKVED